MLEPAENGRLELDLATGMFVEDFSSLNNIDSSNSSDYSIDNGSLSINKQLVTGNGNMHGDNAINGAACMYLTVVDDIAHSQKGE